MFTSFNNTCEYISPKGLQVLNVRASVKPCYLCIEVRTWD